MSKPNTLVIYSYYEKNDQYIKNFEFFLKNALYDDIDYVFYINGHECSLDIPKQSNIRVIPRDNINYDFGAYDDAVNSLNIDDYLYFFFINTSVRGPFIPGRERKKIRWTEPFIKLLTGDVKLVGTTINILTVNDQNDLNKDPLNILTNKGFKPPFPHVQSQVLLLNKEAIKYLLSQQFFEQPRESDFMKFIISREVMISQLILKKGWNINCLLPKYQGLDYRTIKSDINPTSVHGDPYYPNAYFGGSIRPYDVIFIKTNRGVSTDEIIKLTDQYFIYNKNKTDYIEPFKNAPSPSDSSSGYNYKYKSILLYTLLLLLIIIAFILYYKYKLNKKGGNKYKLIKSKGR
jgi:hypothetical protein